MIAAHADRISDYRALDDRIDLDNAAFTQLGPVGQLSAAAFTVGSVALDASDRVIYNAAGQLLSTPTARASARPCSPVTPGTQITVNDLFIVWAPLRPWRLRPPGGAAGPASSAPPSAPKAARPRARPRAQGPRAKRPPSSPSGGPAGGRGTP